MTEWGLPLYLTRADTVSPKWSTCLIAMVLDLVGDKWSLLIVQEMLSHNKHRYGEVLPVDEGITTNILADRLKRLEAS